MSNYNLSDNVNETFDFTIRDMKYSMRYPRTEEVDAVQELNTKLNEAVEAKNADDVKTLGKKLEDFLYQFITPVDHELPIHDALAKENIKVMKNFNTMIRSELSLQ